MAHPGLLFVVGVGLATILYYFFASTPEQMGQSNRRQQNVNRQEPNRTYCSTSASSDPRNRKPYQECMICLDDTNKENAVRLVPCTHVFHKLCIEEWRINGAGNACTCCPICRNKIMGLEEL